MHKYNSVWSIQYTRNVRKKLVCLRNKEHTVTYFYIAYILDKVLQAVN